jgi:hypothetical protein
VPLEHFRPPRFLVCQLHMHLPMTQFFARGILLANLRGLSPLYAHEAIDARTTALPALWRTSEAGPLCGFRLCWFGD